MNHWTDVDLGIDAVPDAQPLGLLHACVQKVRVMRTMHVTTLNREASLSGVHKRAPDGSARRDIDIGIVEDEHGIFAAQLEHHWKQPRRGRLSDPLASWNAAGKDQLVYVGLEYGGSGPSVADQNRENGFGNSSLVHKRLQFHSHPRRELRWLQHNRISGHECGQGVDRRNRQRIVPRRDDADYAMRLAQDAPAFGLHRETAMLDGSFPKESRRIVDQEANSIEHDQHFCQQSFDAGFASLASD